MQDTNIEVGGSENVEYPEIRESKDAREKGKEKSSSNDGFENVHEGALKDKKIITYCKNL